MEKGICPCCLEVKELTVHHVFPQRHYGKGKQLDFQPNKSPYHERPAVGHVSNISNIIETQLFINKEGTKLLGICQECHVKLENYIRKEERKYPNMRFPMDWLYGMAVDNFLRYDLLKLLNFY